MMRGKLIHVMCGLFLGCACRGKMLLKLYYDYIAQWNPPYLHLVYFRPCLAQVCVCVCMRATTLAGTPHNTSVVSVYLSIWEKNEILHGCLCIWCTVRLSR